MVKQLNGRSRKYSVIVALFDATWLALAVLGVICLLVIVLCLGAWFITEVSGHG